MLIRTNGVANEEKFKLCSIVKFQYQEDDEAIPQRIQNVIMETKFVKINTHATVGINEYRLS